MAKILIIFITITCLNAEFAVKSYRQIKNNSVVRQSYEESCGASSIATLLNLTNIKRFSEKDILEVLDKNTNMLSFNELNNALNKLGFNAKAYKLNRNMFEKIFVPFIVKIENDPRFPHFVVVNNINGDFVKVYDPSFGEYLSSKKEFYSVWDKDGLGGYALIIKPNITKELKPNLPRPSQIKEI
ncbi:MULTISPECIES: cysteine peptidase family C39 domain-containing protein [unclassified Campylobacter]|uniref:cysteine peptidase family C39 domain-containing protein n=1 Tax=unclassified Campylobacter TaxID=2593542 RepID=UPI001EFBD7C9|nr:cysteine peptidase family C39 domain-containing protein [Campylobacter sp. RM12651]MBZ7975478.1 peptidase C39 [Campylobacter sp. RM12637]